MKLRLPSTAAFLSLFTGILFLLEPGANSPASAQDTPTATDSQDASNFTGEAVRTALTQAVAALRRMARADERGLFLPPLRVRKIVGWKEVEVKYAEKEVDVAIWEKYKTMEAVSSTSNDQTSAKLREVTRTRIKGYEKQKQLRPDPGGTIVKKEKRPIYGPGGLDHLPAGFWGQNGLAIYAQLQCGVPANDEQFSRSCRELMKYTAVYGLPDRTWDLGWLTVAAVNLPQDTEAQKNLTRRLVNKLLLGQISQGATSGLWGPVCVNPRLFAGMLASEMAWSRKEVAPLEEKLKAKPDDYRLERKLGDAKATIAQFQTQFGEVTTLGRMFDKAVGNLKLSPNPEAASLFEDEFQEVTSVGWPHYIVKEQTADLQCTALALFALREAARNRCLPASTTVPKGMNGQSILPSENTGGIIMRSLGALAKLQTGTKALSECNFWLPSHDFDALRLPELPVDDKQFVEVASPVTAVSMAQTYDALADAALLLGGAPPAFAAQLPNLLARTRDAALSGVEKQVSSNPDARDTVSTPCDLIYYVQPALTQMGNTPQAQSLRANLTGVLLKLQNKEGTWIPRPKYPWRQVSRGGGSEWEEYETSVIARIDVLAERNHTAAQAKGEANAQQPYDPASRSWREKPFLLRRCSLSIKPDVAATAYAMLALAQMERAGDAPGPTPMGLIDWTSIEQMDQKEAEAAPAPKVE